MEDRLRTKIQLQQLISIDNEQYQQVGTSLYTTGRYFLENVKICGTKFIACLTLENYDIVIEAIDSSNIPSLVNMLKYNNLTQFKILVDITVIDRPAKTQRFEIVYLFLSLLYNTRAQLVIKINELQSVPSLICFFSSAAWMEREAWDMFGVFFTGNTDLRRILTDYSFEGHPMRKDFPLTGFIEIYFDTTKNRIVYDKVALSQEYRNFNFTSPWRDLI